MHSSISDRRVALLSAGLLVLFGPWTVASAHGDEGSRGDEGARGDNDDNGKKTDFAFFDGTNPVGEAPAFGGAECTVNGPATLHASVTAHASGPSGFVRLTYEDNDFVQFPIASNGVLQLTQAIGGTPDVSTRVRLSNGGDLLGAKLVGALSAIGSQNVFCRSCLALDTAGGAGCQNNPGP
jgi:hypothetical protein